MSVEPAVRAPVAESERIPALDLIRGAAILGILPANMPIFSGTGGNGPFSPDQPVSTIADKIVQGLTLAFVDAKFITQLAIIFGVGLALQADKAWAANRR